MKPERRLRSPTEPFFRALSGVTRTYFLTPDLWRKLVRIPQRLKVRNMFLVISSSLHHNSRSRVLCKKAAEMIKAAGQEVELVDLQKFELPRCDGGDCYSDKHVATLSRKVSSAQGILLGVPIYNYQAGSSAKNLIELTGKAWEDTVVGFLCAAGGPGSYMSIMSLANALMLDFRTFILPRFIYTTGEEITPDDQIDGLVEERIKQLTDQLIDVSERLLKDAK